MTKQKNNKIKETKKIYINRRFSDTDVDPNDRWVNSFSRPFQHLHLREHMRGQ